MERRKLRRTALFSSKYLLVTPSMERLNDFEAEHSHPPPNTHARTPTSAPLLLPFPSKGVGIAKGWPEPTAAWWGSDLYLWGSTTKLSQKLVVNLCWCPVPRSFFFPPLSWFRYEHRASFYKQRGVGINVLGTVGGDRHPDVNTGNAH